MKAAVPVPAVTTVDTPSAANLPLTGSVDSVRSLDVQSSHWIDDLCERYAKIAHDPFARVEIIRKIHDNSAVSGIVIDSVADTIGSLDWTVTALSDSEYWRNMARISRNEIINSCSRIGGWQQFVAEFVEDYLVSPTGHFAQISYDGNGMPYQLGGIQSRNPRPYVVQDSEIIWAPRTHGYPPPPMNTMALQKRDIMRADGIWWSDTMTYRLPKTHYYQSVTGARGSGAFLVGVSKAERSRVRISLSATLEEYIQRVASGTDKSGLLVLTNVAYQALSAEMEKRRAIRKTAPDQDNESGNILYATNIGDKPADVKWVSFRPFPEGFDIMGLVSMSEEMVAAGYGIKTWRIQPSGDNGSGKFGNAKRAIQIDAQEPGVQAVIAALENLITNVFLRRMPLKFAFMTGTGARDTLRIDNASRLAQTVSQATFLTQEEQRAYAISLGFPKEVLQTDSGVFSGSEGLTKTANNSAVMETDAVSRIVEGIVGGFDAYGIEDVKLEASLKIAKTLFMARGLGSVNATPGGERWLAEVTAVERASDEAVADLRVAADRMATDYSAGVLGADRASIALSEKVLEIVRGM